MPDVPIADEHTQRLVAELTEVRERMSRRALTPRHTQRTVATKATSIAPPSPPVNPPPRAR